MPWLSGLCKPRRARFVWHDQQHWYVVQPGSRERPPSSVREVALLVVEVLVVVGLLFAAAVLATGRGGGMSDETPDAVEPGLPGDRATDAADIAGVRFGLAFRGYRMAEVDDVLDRLAAEIAARDERISELEHTEGAAPAQPVDEQGPPPWAAVEEAPADQTTTPEVEAGAGVTVSPAGSPTGAAAGSVAASQREVSWPRSS